MRCGCSCGAYMIHSESLSIACVCPECGARCNMCLGTNSVVGREELDAYRRMTRPAGEVPETAPDASGYAVRALAEGEFSAATKIIRMGFAPAAWEFGVTEETAPDYSAFVKDENLAGLTVVAAVSDSAIIGAAALGDGCVCHLAVLPSFRKQGIGSAILNEIENIARSAGEKRLSASVIRANAKAREFLERRGYIRAEEEAAASLNLTKIILKKEL